MCKGINNDFDVERIRKDFPILQQTVKGNPLVYLDNSATTQRPQQVIDSINDYYLAKNSNVHRGVHYLSQVAADSYEASRLKVKKFLNAASTNEIIFVSGTTDGINLVANSYGRKNISRGDEIIISTMEHHSNIVPWQILCQQTGAKLRVIPIDDNGSLILEEYEKLLNEKTKLVSIVHISNSLGTINPVKRIIETAHQRGIPVVLDGAQAVPHAKVDVLDLDCDFFAFSAHKMFGPTGIGVLYGKENMLEDMPPYRGGGDMIKSVTFEETIYNDLPYRFEAGTPNIAGAIGLGSAIDYITEIGYDEIEAYEGKLLNYATTKLSTLDRLRIIGTTKKKASVISFVITGAHPHDVGTILDFEGIAVRTGHHCTQPIMDRFCIPGTTRASLSFYNTFDEIDRLMQGLNKVTKVFK